LRTLLKRIVLAVWRPIERRAAGAYLAGPSLSDALAAGDRVAERGYGVILGFWNADGDEAGDVARENLAAIEALAERGGRWYLSIKAPALRYSRELVTEIAQRSASSGTILHLDSHAPDTADDTIAVAAVAREVHDRVGITIPGRWARSLADADRACELGLRVRVAKGEWADPDDPDRDMREGFLSVVGRLAGRASHVSVATHDPELAREAVEKLAAAGTPHDIELLVGLPFEPVVHVAQAAGLPVRVYVPHGHASLRYGLAYLARNPRRIWWLVRDLVLRRRRALPPPLAPRGAARQRGPTETRSR
jgi:proline dehydrogenase